MQPLRGLLPVSLFGEQMHDGYKQFAYNCYPTASWLLFERRPYCSWFQHANHSATEPPHLGSKHVYSSLCMHGNHLSGKSGMSWEFDSCIGLMGKFRLGRLFIADFTFGYTAVLLKFLCRLLRGLCCLISHCKLLCRICTDIVALTVIYASRATCWSATNNEGNVGKFHSAWIGLFLTPYVI